MLVRSKSNMKKEAIFYLLLGIVGIFLIFLPITYIPFYHHDIYKFSTGGFHQACSSNQGHSFIVTLGRPFSAYLDCLNNKIGNTLGGITLIRVCCLLLIGVMVGGFALLLKSRGFSRWVALLISFSVFLLPIVLTIIIMISTTLIVSIMLAFASYFLINLSHLNLLKWKKHDYLTMGLGCFLLMTAFFTYPSEAAFYLVPSLLLVLFQPLSEWRITRKLVVRDTIIFGLASLVYFVLAKALQMYRGVVGVPAAYQFKLNYDFVDRISYLLQKLPDFWNLNAGPFQKCIVYALLLFGCLSALRELYQKKDISKKYLLQAIISILVLVVLGCSVFLVAPNRDIPVSRVIFVFQVMALLALFWSIFQVCRYFRTKKEDVFFLSTALICLMGIYYSSSTITMSALNDNAELNYIASSIFKATHASQPIARIHIIVSNQLNSNGMPAHEDIININSTNYAGDIGNIVNAAMLKIAKRHSFGINNCVFSEIDEPKYFLEERKCIYATFPGDIAVTYSRSGDMYVNTPGTLIIDMNKLVG
jgi:hypothetical protein